MSVKVQDLEPGQEVYGYMRLGFAIYSVRRKDGSVYGQVPSRPQRRRTYDLTRFQGTVQNNNTTEQVITIVVTRTDSLMRAQNRDPLGWSVDIHYSNFSKLLLISPYNYEPRQDNLTFPANLPDAAFKPYRTFTRVILPSYVTGV